MDLSAAISLIQTTAINAKTLHPVVVDDPRNCYFDKHDGNLLVVPVPPEVRNHQVYGVDDLIALVKVATERGWSDLPMLWLAHHGLVFIPRDDDRRDRAELTLVESDYMTVLRRMESHPASTQAQLLHLLRITLGPKVQDGQTLIGKIRQVKFKSSDEQSNDIQRGKESMDRSLMAEMLGVADLPEYVRLTVPVYANPGELDKEYLITCALDPDPIERQFMFAPLPGEIDSLVQKAQLDIRDRLTKALADVPIISGCP